jgi:phage terminase large subunit-like protein
LNDTLSIAKHACHKLRLHISGQQEIDNVTAAVLIAVVRKACDQSFYFFCKEVLGFSLLTSQTHKRWCDELQSNWLKFNHFGRLKPRGTFKTTIYGEGFILWLWACVSPKIRIFYTSANQTLIDEISSHLDTYIGADTESLYSYVFGVKRDAATKNTQEIFNIVGRDKNVKGSSLIMRPAGGSINGVHPHVIIIDDPMDREDRESHAAREYKKRWMDSLHPLLVPFEHEKLGTIKKIMFIATRWHLQDVAAYLIAKPSWSFEIEGVLKPDGSLQYPEFFGLDRINEIKAEIDSVFFACQYLNNPLPEGVQIFQLDQLSFYDLDSHDHMKLGSNFCFFDPSQGKKGSDFPAVIWVNLFNGRKYLFHAIDKKIQLTSLIDMIATQNKKFNVKLMVFETNGAMGVENTLRLSHDLIDCPIAIAGIHETRNKNERIQMMQPDLYRPKNFYFREDYKAIYPELMNQLVFFPAWGADDFPDVIEKACTYLSLMVPGEIKSKNTLVSRGTFSGSLSGGSLISGKRW